MRTFFLLCLALSPTPVLAQNLLTNGDFDTGGLSPWVTYALNAPGPQIGGPGVDASGGVYTPGPATTSGSYLLTKSYGGNLAGGDYGAYQQTAVTPGHLHIVSGDVAGGVGLDGKFNGTARWEVRVIDGPWDPGQVNGGLAAFTRTMTTEGGFNWTHFSYGFTPTSPTVTVVIHYTGVDPTWDYLFFAAYFDSISLVDAITTCVNPSNITSVSPNRLTAPPDLGDQTFTFSGTNLDQITGVTLQHETGTPTLVGEVQSQTASTIVAKFNFSGVPLGYYTVTGTRSAPCPNAILSQAVEVACSSDPATLATAVHDRGQSGSVHDILLTGTNLGSITGVRLIKRNHNNGNLPGSVNNPIVGTGLTMVGEDLKVTFDLANAEAGWYSIVCSHPCNQVNNDVLRKGFLVYLAEITNGSFEEDYFGNVGEDPCNGGSRNNPKPKHWDIGINSGDGAYVRDGDIFFPVCDGTNTKGIEGKHYVTRQLARNGPGSDSIFQTIGAPAVNRFNVRADFAILGGTPFQPNTARIILHDGSDTDAVIAEVTIPSAWEEDNSRDGLFADPDYNVEVPDGYVYMSDPPLLTIEIRFETTGGGVNTFHGFGADYVRTGPFIDRGCNLLIWADADADTDVDMDDFGDFQRCYTGNVPGIPSLPGYPCACFDRDFNDQVNEFDFTAFKNCLTRPAVPWSQESTPLCEPER